MLAYLLLASSAPSPAIPQAIHADAAPLLVATRGLVRDARPVLGYDMQAVAAYAGRGAHKPMRLGYAGFDKGGHDWPELVTAHQTAADIVRGDAENTNSGTDRN